MFVELRREEEEEKGEGEKLAFLAIEQTRGYALILIPSEKNKQKIEETQLRTSETTMSSSTTTTLDFFLLLDA